MSDAAESQLCAIPLSCRLNLPGRRVLHLRPEHRRLRNMSTHSGYTHERMNSYRNGAQEAVNLAFPCEDAELRDAYLAIAKTWAELADKIERELRAKREKASPRELG